MRPPKQPVSRVTARPESEEEIPEQQAHWRGLVALMLLCDTWQHMPVLRVVTCTP